MIHPKPAPEELLRVLPPGTRPLVERVLEAARRLQVPVYLVGGPVRDFLLGRALRDVDLIVEEVQGRGALEVALEAAPQEARLVHHGRFGTVRLETASGGVDLATVRREQYAHPGALPSVEPGRLEDDLRRRDFTVNALALPLFPSAPRGKRGGELGIIDLDQGLSDLEKRILRVFHPRSFHDDPTRALRAARFATRLGFTLSRGARSALRDALRDGAFGRVSGDRLRHEIEKLFEDSQYGLDPAAAMRLLAEWHVLGALEPGLAFFPSAVAPLRRFGRAALTPPWPRRHLRVWAAGLAVWLAPLELGIRTRALRRFSVRGESARRIAGFPKLRDTLLRRLATERGRGALDALLAGLAEEDLLALYAWAGTTARRRIVRYAAEDRGRRPPMDGQDLLVLGLTGPAVGKALARIRAAYLNGTIRNRDDALALARELARHAVKRAAVKRGTGGAKRANKREI